MADDCNVVSETSEVPHVHNRVGETITPTAELNRPIEWYGPEMLLQMFQHKELN